MTNFFFICSIKSRQCTDKYSKISHFFSTAIFLSRVLMYQKRQISLPVGYKTTRRKNRRLGTYVTSFQDFKLREKQISATFSYFLINNALFYHFLANWLAQNKKMTEKSVFHEARSPEMTSQSFPVSCFWCRGFVPTGSENSRFWYSKTRERKIAIENFSLLYISVLWGDLVEQIKKKLSYTLSCFLLRRRIWK